MSVFLTGRTPIQPLNILTVNLYTSYPVETKNPQPPHETVIQVQFDLNASERWRHTR
jgi:hypothetical protein